MEQNMGVGGGHIIVSSMATKSFIYDNLFLDNYFESLLILFRYKLKCYFKIVHAYF